MPEAFQWFLERGEEGILAVSSDLLMVDAQAAPLLRVFSHRELWRWAHDQSQAVVGWQSLPFPDGRASRLRWLTTTSTGAIAGAVIGVEERPSHQPGGVIREGAGVDVQEMIPGESELARTIRGQLAALLHGSPSLRIRGAPGVGKDFVADRFIERYGASGTVRQMDPLVLRGDQMLGDPVWIARLHDAVDQRRPVVFHDLDRIPEHRIHGFLPALTTARERKVAVVATESLQVVGFADRMWSRAFRDVVELPALRARREDIPAVVRAIWKTRLGRTEGPRISAEAQRMLAAADWPANVTQLEKVLLEAHERCGGNRIEPWALRLPVTGASSNLRGIEHAEYTIILEELRRCEGNKSMAARVLGISRSTLYRKMRLYGISARD